MVEDPDLPQQTTEIGKIKISSVKYSYEISSVEQTRQIDETCVFFPGGGSEVVGRYSDHSVVVNVVRAMIENS